MRLYRKNGKINKKARWFVKNVIDRIESNDDINKIAFLRDEVGYALSLFNKLDIPYKTENFLFWYNVEIDTEEVLRKFKELYVKSVL